jgi:hypothetical protein
MGCGGGAVSLGHQREGSGVAIGVGPVSDETNGLCGVIHGPAPEGAGLRSWKNITERYVEAGWTVEQGAAAEDLPVETVRRMREDLEQGG